ncbi:hypothetical protein RCL_jg27643.t1 [Rhizophagus clarus]|uniref:Uncharacterized protein n=1 Tax=Rhizophagus clarus TaxID=94130 RepID=A0A8H3LZY6_9GLOM|nr:hypothetical protein RCL_jg27643.t1 [Rhizophagus clarus]
MICEHACKCNESDDESWRGTLQQYMRMQYDSKFTKVLKLRKGWKVLSFFGSEEVMMKTVLDESASGKTPKNMDLLLNGDETSPEPRKFLDFGDIGEQKLKENNILTDKVVSLIKDWWSEKEKNNSNNNLSYKEMIDLHTQNKNLWLKTTFNINLPIKTKF